MIIDDIFINLINAYVISGNILTQISDHRTKLLILKNASIPQHKLAVFNQTIQDIMKEILLVTSLR